MKLFTLTTSILLQLLISIPAFSQVVSKEQSKSGSDIKSANQNEPVDFSFSRNEDIRAFEDNMKKFQNAVEMKSKPEAEVYRSANVKIANREIARSKNNLEELKQGKTKHLDEWRKVNGKGDQSLNINLEIQQLTDRLKNMEYNFKKFKTASLDNLSDTRMSNSFVSYMKSFDKNMKQNVKYESDKKVITVVPPPPGDKKLDGPAYITDEKVNTLPADGNQMLTDFKQSQSARASKFAQDQTSFQNYLQAKDYKSAKRAFKNLVPVMQEEIESNNFLKIQTEHGAISKESVNLTQLNQKIAEQRKISDEAGKIKLTLTNDADFDQTKLTELISQFALTLK